MNELRLLLPRKSSPLDNALVDVVDSRFRYNWLSRYVIDVRNAATIRTDLLPWLLRDKGLDAAMPFVDDWQLLYDEGVLWLDERGTDAAQHRAFRWLGQGDAILDPLLPGSNRWAEYQIGLRTAPETLAPLPSLIGMSRLSKPARSLLNRVYGGFDRRAIRLDNAVADAGLLDFDSGVVIREDWPILSFGRAVYDVLDTTASHFAAGDTVRRIDVGNAMYVDDVMLDWSVPDDQLKAEYRKFQITLVLTSWAADQIDSVAAISGHLGIKAAIGLDAQWDVNDVNQVFPGLRFERSGDAWLADSFAPERDTEWLAPKLVEEIIRASASGAATYQGPAANATLASPRLQTFVAFDVIADASSMGILSASTEQGAGGYDGQNWVDLRAPEDATWQSLDVMIGA